MSILNRLQTRVDELNSPICLGLDPRFQSIPCIIKFKARKLFKDEGDVIRHSIRLYHELILDSIGHLVPAVKLQLAFYEQYGVPGMKAYVDTLLYAKSKGVFVIADAKRSDVPATPEAYARAFLNPSSEFSADSMTIVPYIGLDSMLPYIEAAERYDRCIYVVVKTSNPGSGDVQDVIGKDGSRIFEHVCKLFEKLSDEQRDKIGIVFACSRYSDAAFTIRRQLPEISVLIVGYGVQGGTAEHVVPLFTNDGKRAIVNSSRKLTYQFDNPIDSIEGLKVEIQRNLQSMQSEICDALANQVSRLTND